MGDGSKNRYTSFRDVSRSPPCSTHRVRDPLHRILEHSLISKL